MNKTAISFDTNRIIGGKNPADYVKLLEKRSGVEGPALDHVLRTHYLDPSALRAGNFDSFFSRRRTALIELISDAMGTPVVEDLTEMNEASDAALYESEADDISDDDLVTQDVAI